MRRSSSAPRSGRDVVVGGVVTTLRLRGNQPVEQRLLGVPAVLRLVPDPLAVAVEDLGGDLLTGMRGEAVQRDGPGRGRVEEGVVEPVRRERLAAGAGLGLVVAHR